VLSKTGLLLRNLYQLVQPIGNLIVNSPFLQILEFGPKLRHALNPCSEQVWALRQWLLLIRSLNTLARKRMWVAKGIKRVQAQAASLPDQQVTPKPFVSQAVVQNPLTPTVPSLRVL
jgi:hypothetical protein